MMEYSPKIQTLKQKYTQFFNDPSPGQILATICPYTYALDYTPWGAELGDRRLDSWDLDRDMHAYVACQVKRLQAFMEHTAALDNDYVPAMGLNFGYGAHSAYFSGAEVLMGDDTSWTRPFLDSWDQLETLTQNPNNRWFQRILEGYRMLREMCDGTYALSAFCNAGPGDMANAIRGDELFVDLYENPEQVHQLMDKCADALIWLEEAINNMIGGVEGGTVTANMYFPGNAPYLSEDFSDLCAAETYAAFGRIHTQKVLDHFKGAYIHHHAKGAHIHGELATLNHLKTLEQSWDPNCCRPVDRLPELFSLHNGLPLMIRCHARDVYAHIEDLKRGRVIIMLNIDTLDEGKEVMRFIRRHSIL